MKYQALFSSKDKSKIQLVSSAAIFVGALRVKCLFRIRFSRNVLNLLRCKHQETPNLYQH